MSDTELHIFEEQTNLFWGLIIVVATAGGVSLLGGTFASGNWFAAFSIFSQVLSLLLFGLSFYGIKRISDPLFHFIFYVQQGILSIHIFKGEKRRRSIRLELASIREMRFSIFNTQLRTDALFDFTTNYCLMYREVDDEKFQQLIDLRPTYFTLKADDIAKIIRFLQKHHPEIQVPEDQASYFELYSE